MSSSLPFSIISNSSFDAIFPFRVLTDQRNLVKFMFCAQLAQSHMTAGWADGGKDPNMRKLPEN
jgi:hypothetical protein